MSRPLVIIGCGGFGREVFSLVDAVNVVGEAIWDVVGFVDDDPSDLDRARVDDLGTTVLGPLEALLDRPPADAAVIAIGSATARRQVAGRLATASVDFPTLVHPSATLGRKIHLGEGAVVAAGGRLSTNITVGQHVHVDQNATVGHDTVIGSCSRLNPQACVSGSVRIGDGVVIGANATVLAGLQVGDGATVGAQACVVRDVASGTTVKGVPAR